MARNSDFLQMLDDEAEQFPVGGDRPFSFMVARPAILRRGAKTQDESSLRLDLDSEPLTVGSRKFLRANEVLDDGTEAPSDVFVPIEAVDFATRDIDWEKRIVSEKYAKMHDKKTEENKQAIQDRGWDTIRADGGESQREHWRRMYEQNTPR